MATKGAKPKPAHLRLIDGTRNATRHGTEEDLRRVADQGLSAFGPLKSPKGLRGKALLAWKRWIAPATWLDASREPAAIAFCHLWEEFEARPQMFPASKHGQMRAYMSELGLTDERNRAGSQDKQVDEFFG